MISFLHQRLINLLGLLEAVKLDDEQQLNILSPLYPRKLATCSTKLLCLDSATSAWKNVCSWHDSHSLPVILDRTDRRYHGTAIVPMKSKTGS